MGADGPIPFQPPGAVTWCDRDGDWWNISSINEIQFAVEGVDNRVDVNGLVSMDVYLQETIEFPLETQGVSCTFSRKKTIH